MNNPKNNQVKKSVLKFNADVKKALEKVYEKEIPNFTKKISNDTIPPKRCK